MVSPRFQNIVAKPGRSGFKIPNPHGPKLDGAMQRILASLICLSILSFLPGLIGCTSSSFKTMFRKDVADLRESIPLTAWNDSYEAALKESEATGKPVLADFTGSDWCQWCVKLKRDVFETEEFKQWADENVVLLELDYPKRSQQSPEIARQNAQLKDRYNIKSYPTVLLLDSSGQVLGELGYMSTPQEWIATAQSFLGFVAETTE
jgi:thioredoxin-related protein